MESGFDERGGQAGTGNVITMAEEIVNRVANSSLKVIDLEDYYPQGQRMSVDISQWLYEGLVLREKPFRAALADHDWSQYRDAYINVLCTTDAIVPSWAFMLVSAYLQPYAKKVFEGDSAIMEQHLFEDVLRDFDAAAFEGLPVIIKGCSDKYVPQSAYITLTAMLKPYARSIMYGEACSSVPIYKRK